MSRFNLKLLSVKELSERTGLSIWTIYELVERKRIPHLRLGSRKIYFMEEDIYRWLEEKKVEPKNLLKFYP